MYMLQILSSVVLSASTATALSLNITAIGASKGASTLECWQMDTPLSVATIPGIVGSASAVLSNASNVTFTVLPAAFDGGLHNAPFNQWVAFVSGLAYITLPTNNTASAYVPGGEFGLIFAADTAALSAQGHRTQYPGLTETVALAIPTEDGSIPAHSVLHYGGCTAGDIGGIRGLATGSTDDA